MAQLPAQHTGMQGVAGALSGKQQHRARGWQGYALVEGVLLVAEFGGQGGDAGREDQRLLGQREVGGVRGDMQVLVGEGDDLGDGQAEQQDKGAGDADAQRQGRVGQAATQDRRSAGLIEEDVRVLPTDLKTEFYQRIQKHGATPDVEIRLRATVTKLKETITNKNKELRQLRADVPALVRAINQLTLENQQLREQLAHPDPNIIPFPSRRSTHPND